MNERSRKLLKIAKRSVSIKSIMFLMLILVFNTCAWYIYISEVSSDITSHVKSWKIELGNNISQNVNFEVENIYPGMEDATQTIEITNSGEVPAEVICEISEMTILGTTYTADGTNVTPTQLVRDIANNYPFSLKFYINDVQTDHMILGIQETCTIKIEITWPFNLGDDEEDTYWGNLAYDYMQENSEGTCIQITAKVKANQVE